MENEDTRKNQGETPADVPPIATEKQTRKRAR